MKDIRIKKLITKRIVKTFLGKDKEEVINISNTIEVKLGNKWEEIEVVKEVKFV